MNSADHHRKLESMYLKAKVQDMYPGIGIAIEDGKSVITLPVSERYFHAGMAVHGSVYFRLLDDAAYFAVLSQITDVFILTTSFQIDLLRPVVKGILTASGEVLHKSKSVFHAHAIITDERGKKVAIGKGSFMKSEMPLTSIKTYENE